jgi:hypothetical protein
MTTFTIGADEFRALVNPVLPMAGTDVYLPAINSVLIEGRGKWLSATATDRFRVGIKRIAKTPTDDDTATEWPEFKANIPLRSVKSMLTTFKSPRGSLPARITFTIEGGTLTVEASGAFDLFDAARFTHQLEPGEFPGVRAVIRQALETPEGERMASVGINPAYMADFKASGAKTLRVLVGAAQKPLVVTDGEGFIGALMPRGTAVADEDWTDFLAAPKKADEKAA